MQTYQQSHYSVGMKSFKSRRSKPELVAPARATPRETKALSDIDDAEQLRFLQPHIEFIGVSSADGQRPAVVGAAKVVKEALAEALVYYYPLAGRLRHAPGGKLVIECTGEGVVFVEAEAVDVSMDDLGNPPSPPYPCVQELMCEVAHITDVVGAPLFFMQVTQLRCGGFVIGVHKCHTIADGYGLIQFLKAIADLARGETAGLVLPIWQRDLLSERTPPRINHVFQSFLERPSSHDIMLSTPPSRMLGRYFLFGPRDIAALRSHAPRQPVTTFELLTAVMWRCRTKALGYELHHRVRLMLSVNARGRWKRPTPIPRGYYGNAAFLSVVDATVADLCGSPLCHTIDLVRQAKNNMTHENMESMVDVMASLRGKPQLRINRVYEVSDTKWFGTDALDFGWAKRISGGAPMVGDAGYCDSVGYHIRCTNDKGENIIAVSMLLPIPAMEKFASEIAAWLNGNVQASL